MKDDTNVTAILIDPDQQSITQIVVPVHPLDGGIHTNDIALDELYRILDCTYIGAFCMSADDTCLYDDSKVVEAKPANWFQFEETSQPMAGRALLIGFDMMSHTYKDVTTQVADLQRRVLWSERAVIGYKIAAKSSGIKITRLFG